MNLLFIGYWGVNEGLTTSTILPHLRILAKFPNINKIVFCSVERDNNSESTELGIEKVVHIPLVSKNISIKFLNKFNDFYTFTQQLLSITQKYQIDKMICRASPAGALGYLVWIKTKIPYNVESFEPHAEYMLESGVWKKFDPRYILQSYWEKQQKRTATRLMPVAFNYQKKLVEEGVEPDKIDVIPCCVPLEEFAFDRAIREQTRNKLVIDLNAVVGIYVGKFGGIYYDQEAFEVFKEAFDVFDNFRLILLTPEQKETVVTKLKAVGIDETKVFITLAAHHEVSHYLSASDFAFSLQYYSPSKAYLSPIKNGEYWANGLPILLTEGVGDDHEIVEKENGGTTFNLEGNNLQQGLRKIKKLIDSNSREALFEKIKNLAVKYRSFQITRNVYQKAYGITATETNKS